MRLLKIKLLLFLLTTTMFLQAQTVTQVEWWYDDDYSTVEREPASGKDFVWRKDISTPLLKPGLHRLNLRFKDNASYWSGATSHYFLKLDGVHGNVISDFHYWLGDDITKSQSMPLSTVELTANSNIGIVLNLDMDNVPNGLHQLNFTVGYVNGVRSAISTTFFYKCDNAISLADMVFEYWIDNNFDGKMQKNFANLDGISILDLDLSGFKEGGLHRLNYRIGNKKEAFGNIYTHYFFNNRIGANVLEWTFDDNPTVYSRPLNSPNENIIFDLPTNNLANGVHSVKFRTGHQNGNYSTPTTAWFVKGDNPYAPALSGGEQLVSEYIYWFDNLLETDMLETLQPPVKTYLLDKNVEVPEDLLGRGEHFFHIKAKDTYGQWGETFTQSFKAMNGNVKRAKIKNLEPNVNPISHRIKKLATIYRYYRVFSELNVPVKGAVITYTVGDKEFTTSPSDAEGYITIAFQTWGNDAKTEKDDYVEEGNASNNRMFFSGLWTDTKKTAKIEVVENDFNFANLIVSDYQPNEQEYALELEVKAKGSLETNWVDRLVSVSDKPKMSFIFKYEDDWYGKSQLSELKYAFQNTFSASLGEKFKTPTPVLSGSVSLEDGFIHKYKMESELSSYFRTAYDLLCGILDNTGNTDTKLFAIVKAIGNFLEDPPEMKDEGSLGLTTNGNAALKLDISMGEIPEEVSPIKFKLETKWGVKGTYEFGNSSTRKGVLGKPHTYSDYLKNDIKKSFDVSSSLDFGDYAAIDGMHFGVGVNYAESGGMKIERSMNANRIPTEGTITTTQSSEYDVSAEFSTAAMPWLPTFHVKAGKEYSSKYTIKKDILDNKMYFPINDPLWNYLNNKTNSVALGNADEIMPNIANIGKGLSTQNPQFYNIVNNNFNLKTTKKYTSGIGVSKKIGVDMGFLGIDWSVEVSAYALLDAKYPLGEFYYHPTTNKMYAQVKYADIDKPEYWFSPVQMLDDLWENCWKSLKSRAIQIAARIADYLEEATAWISGDNKILSNASTPRQYANSLKNYSKLRATTQTNKSVMEFHIPGNNQSFNNDTEVKLEWFYPGGELLGKTANLDTMVVISDLFFLSAVHKWDTLSVAPLGNFKIYATVGVDDLAFLDINPSYPVSVYYQSLEDATSTWHLIGSVNNMIEYNKLGMYCLGVGISDDKEPPAINISKAENANTVDISITDNMAVYWKNVYILVNGLSIEYERNGSNISIPFTEEQLAEDIYITVYATDLARNTAQKSEMFAGPTGIASPKVMDKDFKLYPNPATEIVHLAVTNKLSNEKIAYAIVNPLGQILHKELIRNEETVIDVSSFPAGVYFVVIHNEEQIITSLRLVKK